MALYRCLLATEEASVTVRKRLVLNVAKTEVTLHAISIHDFAARLVQLRMRRRHVVGLHERFLRDLPVRGNGDGFPPVVARLTDREILDEVAYRSDEILERLRVPIQVDEHEAGEYRRLHFFQCHVAVAQLAAAEFTALQHELI